MTAVPAVRLPHREATLLPEDDVPRSGGLSAPTSTSFELKGPARRRPEDRRADDDLIARSAPRRTRSERGQRLLADAGVETPPALRRTASASPATPETFPSLHLPRRLALPGLPWTADRQRAAPDGVVDPAVAPVDPYSPRSPVPSPLATRAVVRAPPSLSGWNDVGAWPPAMMRSSRTTGSKESGWASCHLGCTPVTSSCTREPPTPPTSAGARLVGPPRSWDEPDATLPPGVSRRMRPW